MNDQSAPNRTSREFTTDNPATKKNQLTPLLNVSTRFLSSVLAAGCSTTGGWPFMASFIAVVLP